MSISNIVRDRLRRLLSAHYDVRRQALKQIIKTRSLPLITRIKAQHEFQKLPSYSSLVGINKRCIVSGRSRDINEFKVSPIVFRGYSLSGMLPGVRKSCW